MRSRSRALAILTIVLATAWAGAALAQQPRMAMDPNGANGAGAAVVKSERRAWKPYKEPTQKQKLHVYEEEMFGPYALTSVAFVSGLHQAEHVPPDWQEGASGFGIRLASNFGTSMASATAKYGLSEALGEDTLYYRCRCTRFWPRLGHAVVSSFEARKGADGREVFGLPELVSPYAGPFTAVYGWYPRRYGWKDAFRMGNHGLLDEVGTNISLEFLPTLLRHRGRRWMDRLHLKDPAGAQ